MENITFEEFDKFERKPLADRLTTVLTKFYPFYDESFVLSLNAKYGSGKTTFLKMWENELKAKGHHVIYINAWETDFDDEPIIPLISELIEQLKDKKKTEKIKKATQGVMGASALVASQVTKKLSGVNVEEVIDRAQKDFNYGDIVKVGAKLYKGYSFKREAYEKLKSSLKDYTENQEVKPLFIFVDELDRVRPNYAVKFLEAIKHIFSIQGICFVIATDRDQLEKSVKQLYGDIDFSNYYLRFITRESELPEITNLKIDLNPFINSLGKEFFDEKRLSGVQFPFKENDQSYIIDYISTITKAHRFTPRQIEAFFRIFSQLMAVTSEKTAKKDWVLASVFLIATSISNSSFYHRLGRDDASPEELHEYILSLTFPKETYDTTEDSLLLSSFRFFITDDEQQHETVAIKLLKYRNEEVNDDKKNSMIRYLSSEEGHPFSSLNRTSKFHTIYTMLEEWRPFIE